MQFEWYSRIEKDQLVSEVIRAQIPNTGTTSETCGRISFTILWKTVSDKSTVTPVKECVSFDQVTNSDNS